MNYLELRKKYPEFIYKRFKHEVIGQDLVIDFEFECGELNFHPKTIFKNIPIKKFKSLDSGVSDNFVFHLGLIEMFSYWKATCSPKILIEAGYLNGEQINWWRSLLLNGMGQYFYENKIDFNDSNFISIKSDSDMKFAFGLSNTKSGVLIPVGGGKDSAVTLELLKDQPSAAAFVVNPTKASLDCIEKSGIAQKITAERTIDLNLVKLNELGFLNGHTPYSALIAFMSVFAAYIYGYREVALSNERSSDEENTTYLGRKINHQYSKTFEFENEFRNYFTKYISDINYFSFLRPLYDLQIAKIFSANQKYFSVFRSCNVGQKTNTWCGDCSKCLSTYILLKPFLSDSSLLTIFKENLLTKPSLQNALSELLDPEKVKPFECVGTKEELKKALAGDLSLIKTWNDNNNLQKKYETILRREI